MDCTASFELPLRARDAPGRRREPGRERDSLRGDGATCSITCSESPAERRLVVADNGTGVAEEELPRLFERFYRADHARSTMGTGLGLAIVKHIVAAASGTVEATATPGGGLTVTCSFPAKL